MGPKKDAKIWEFGDFQTPPALATEAVRSLKRHLSFTPKTIIEPTCGVGGFLLAAADAFPDAERIVGVDIEGTYIDILKAAVASKPYADRVQLIHGDFFQVDWLKLLPSLPEPILIVGNPPWVTNADMGLIKGSNLPTKSNFQNRTGFDAVTGKANFDISESMLLGHLDWLKLRSGGIAMLCKTAVARKVLTHAWRHDADIQNCRMVQIDAMKYFRASVDACFLTIDATRNRQKAADCRCYGDFAAEEPIQTIGYHEGLALSDVDSFYRLRHMIGIDKNYVWRSGLKHDCARVMELRRAGSRFINGSQESVDIEDEFVYPLLKSSDIANGRIHAPRAYVIVTQTYVGEDTGKLERAAPRTWRYLVANGSLLDRRGSTIYKNKPRFSVFGIGPYAFSEWKVAISGFYKTLDFKVVSVSQGKPFMLDDTGYFLGCGSAEEAQFIAGLLNSLDAKELLNAMIFWMDKRPITVDLLKRVHIGRLASHLGMKKDYEAFLGHRNALPLFETSIAARAVAAE